MGKGTNEIIQNNGMEAMQIQTERAFAPAFMKVNLGYVLCIQIFIWRLHGTVKQRPLIDGRRDPTRNKMLRIISLEMTAKVFEWMKSLKREQSKEREVGI